MPQEGRLKAGSVGREGGRRRCSAPTGRWGWRWYPQPRSHRRLGGGAGTASRADGSTYGGRGAGPPGRGPGTSKAEGGRKRTVCREQRGSRGWLERRGLGGHGGHGERERRPDQHHRKEVRGSDRVPAELRPSSPRPGHSLTQLPGRGDAQSTGKLFATDAPVLGGGGRGQPSPLARPHSGRLCRPRTAAAPGADAW